MTTIWVAAFLRAIGTIGSAVGAIGGAIGSAVGRPGGSRGAGGRGRDPLLYLAEKELAAPVLDGDPQIPGKDVGCQ